ncbi:uridine kinase [Cetobacterium ceti]|uniref:Uridine kinase n=1 Tax=Cetobacterium ceti TaxID=180163 RepID=A0A1T4JWU1_9FUSO|nr:nucleoside kinase [Cetobacterium ceti]SJZ34722.1 uridine kinase [Cetobacterium ceti]
MKNFNERKYYETLKFILFKSVNELYPKLEIRIENSLNNGVYCRVLTEDNITEDKINKIKKKMDELIKKDLEIKLICDNIEKIKKKINMISREDVKRLVENIGLISIKEYEMEGYRDYFYEELYSRTGYIYLYDLYLYGEGFILKFPKNNNPKKLPEYVDYKKLGEVFKESALWHSILDVSCVGCLNEKNLEEKMPELIRINEILHNSKLNKIAKEIIKNKKIKIVTIAGPSSSGKTTFTKKLRLHLMSEQLNPLVISLDDYYVGRDNLPLDENGEKDYESIDALDIKLLNENLEKLLRGETVEIPKYDFKSGKRCKEGKIVKLMDRGIILIEGIHGLNDKLLKNIQKENKYKIYISCLTQLNIDSRNRIYTSDVRKIRRIVRDMLGRGTSGEETLEMWEKVRAGEEKNIFPYQENADAIYDSSLVYELGVLKILGEKELIKVKPQSKFYEEAKRLLKFLDYFLPVESSEVPDDSILKEFIGGSFFYKY